MPFKYQVINGSLLPCANSVTAPARMPGAEGVNATFTVQLLPAVYCMPAAQVLPPGIGVIKPRSADREDAPTVDSVAEHLLN